MTHSLVFIILWLFCMCQVLLYRINRNTLHIPPFSTNEKRLFYHRHSNSWQYTKQPLKLCEYFFHNKSAGSERNPLKVCRFVRYFCCVGFDSLFLWKLLKGIHGFTPENFTLKAQKKPANASFFGWISIWYHQYGAGDRTWTCTVLPIEPKSIASANSATPAYKTTLLFYHKLPTLSRPFAQKNARCSKHRTDFL